ncbi:hypothetical protein WNY51_00180 [Pseudocolwellia sp. AS88]|uniref:hypothetical protein n=1 Tax=Pseudocolwellia sp. AS88 TaxID=3063958 RepID=UPI0026EC1A55|nr:hypothetical protein [Pseudocolwellia sp. AS88]MDO7084756.1 hypothetical protein [Pseudocolwellia sp. AS88]
MDFFENGLFFFCNNYINETERLKRFTETIEAVWTERGNELDLNLKSNLSKAPECDHQDIGENFSYDYIEMVIKYQFLHRQSIVITASSLVETALYKLCELTSSVSGKKFDLKTNKSRKSKIHKCIEHLSVVENFNMDDLKEELDHISILYKVRNEIVHNNGMVTEKLYRLNLPHLKGSFGYTIEINVDFMDFYLKIIKIFFEKLKIQTTEFIGKMSNNNISKDM